MQNKYGFNLCRLCLTKTDYLMDIFKVHESNGIVVAHIISELFCVNVSRDDDYPKVICKECHSRLKSFYRMRNRFQVEILPTFVLFKNQSQIVSSTIEYAKRYNVATPDHQHSPVSWDHSPLSLELEELAEEEELQTRRAAVGELLDSVAQILKSIRDESKRLCTGEEESVDPEDEVSFTREEIPSRKGNLMDDAPSMDPLSLYGEEEDSSTVNDKVSNVPTRACPKNLSKVLNKKHKKVRDCSLAKAGKRILKVDVEKVLFKKDPPRSIRKTSSEQQCQFPGVSRVTQVGEAIEVSENAHPLKEEVEDDVYKCVACSKVYIRKKDLEKHERQHHNVGGRGKEVGQQPQGDVPSPDCRPSAACDPGSQGRTESVRERSPYQCAVCRNKFQRISDLEDHVLRAHLNQDDDNQADTSSASVSSRGNGSPAQRTEKNKKVIRHSRTEEMWEKMVVSVEGEEEWVRCRGCGIRFTGMNDLKEHILDTSPPEEEEKKKKKRKKRKASKKVVRYKCCLCQEQFNWLVMLERHVKTRHSNERPHVCEECGFAFKLEKYLKKHAKMHTQEKMVKCEDCGKMFADRSRLKLHSAVHSVEELFECGDCGKKFRAKHLLRVHLRVHDKSSRVKCPECPSEFTQRSDLKKHMARHSRVRNFKCSHCNKEFLYKRNLNSHIRLHKTLKVALYS